MLIPWLSPIFLFSGCVPFSIWAAFVWVFAKLCGWTGKTENGVNRHVALGAGLDEVVAVFAELHGLRLTIEVVRAHSIGEFCEAQNPDRDFDAY